MLVAVSSQMTSSRLIWGLLKPIMVLYIYIMSPRSLSLKWPLQLFGEICGHNPSKSLSKING